MGDTSINFQELTPQHPALNPGEFYFIPPPHLFFLLRRRVNTDTVVNQACNLILNIRYKHEFTPAVIFNKKLNTYNINLDHCLNIYVIAGIKVNGISSYQLLIKSHYRLTCKPCALAFSGGNLYFKFWNFLKDYARSHILLNLSLH